MWPGEQLHLLRDGRHRYTAAEWSASISSSCYCKSSLPIPHLEFLYSKILHFPLPSSGSVLLCAISALVYRLPLLGVAASPESLIDKSCKPTEEERVMRLLSLFPLILRALLEAMEDDTFYASYIGQQQKCLGRPCTALRKCCCPTLWFLLFFAKQGFCGNDGFTTGRINLFLENTSHDPNAVFAFSGLEVSVFCIFSSTAKP